MKISCLTVLLHVQMHKQALPALPRATFPCAPAEFPRENGKESDAGGSRWEAGYGDGSCQLSFGKRQLLALFLYPAPNDKLFIFQSSVANTLHLLVLPCAPSTAQTQEHIKSR